MLYFDCKITTKIRITGFCRRFIFIFLRNRLQVYRLFLTFARLLENNTMTANDQTLQQIDRVIKKIADQFPAVEEPTTLTDIHLRVNQETGELLAFDDDDNEITRCVVEQWIDNKDDSFYADVTSALRKRLASQQELLHGIALLKPYSFVLEDDERENIAELYVVDDDTAILDKDLMEGLDKELDDFLAKLLS